MLMTREIVLLALLMMDPKKELLNLLSSIREGLSIGHREVAVSHLACASVVVYREVARVKIPDGGLIPRVVAVERHNRISLGACLDSTMDTSLAEGLSQRLDEFVVTLRDDVRTRTQRVVKKRLARALPKGTLPMEREAVFACRMAEVCSLVYSIPP